MLGKEWITSEKCIQKVKSLTIKLGQLFLPLNYSLFYLGMQLQTIFGKK